MKRILIIFFGIYITSCSQDCCDGPPDPGIRLRVFNQNNEDLLNPETEGYIKERSIKLFYEKEGQLETYYIKVIGGISVRVQLDTPDYFIHLSPVGNMTTNYISWGDERIDTLKYDLFKKTGYLNKAWYNDSLFFSSERQSENPYRVFGVIK